MQTKSYRRTQNHIGLTIISNSTTGRSLIWDLTLRNNGNTY